MGIVSWIVRTLVGAAISIVEALAACPTVLTNLIKSCERRESYYLAAIVPLSGGEH